MDIAKAEDNPFAIAAAQAKQKGYTDSKRKKIAEAIKRD